MYHQIFVIFSQVLVGCKSTSLRLPITLANYQIVLLIVRTYALYGQSRRILGLLLCGGLTAVAIGMVKFALGTSLWEI